MIPVTISEEIYWKRVRFFFILGKFSFYKSIEEVGVLGTSRRKHTGLYWRDPSRKWRKTTADSHKGLSSRVREEK